MKFGEMCKVNFAVGNATPEIMDYVESMRAAAGSVAGGEAETSLKGTLNKNAGQTLALDRRSLPSSGLIYPGVSVQPTSQDRSQSSEAFVLGGVRPDNASPVGSGLVGFSSLGPTGATQPSPLTPYGGNAPVPNLPSVSLEQAIEANAGGDRFGFVDLKDHDTLPMAQTVVRVKGVAGGRLGLLVNGREVPESRIGKRATLTAQGVEAIEFVGVDLAPGENQLEVVQTDQFGNKRGSKRITVIAPDRLGSIRIKTPDNAIADGKTPAHIVVELVDDHGVPVTARTPLTLEATMGKWLVNDSKFARIGRASVHRGGPRRV